MSPSEQRRHTKGLAIASLNSSIKRINKLHYRVKSQTDDAKWYDVVEKYGRNIGGRKEGEWTCICPDYSYRHTTCKHIYAVAISKELRRRIISEDIAPPIIPIPSSSSCKRCKAENSIIKYGIRHNKSGDIQRYRCKVCDHKFIVNDGFERNRANPKVVTAALDLYFKGVSLRKVCDHLKQFYKLRISHVALIKWIRKFGKVVKPYVDSISPPKLSGIYHVDEMMILTKREKIAQGNYQWLWNLMDDTTRFWISSMVSQRREINDARNVFKDTKRKTKIPKAIIHDGLPSYDEAFQKEFYTKKNPRVRNIRSISVRNQGLNSKVERLNGTIREREKVMRGMQKRETAQQIVDAMRVHYNFVREHQTLKKTPAEQAGINLPIGDNKIESLFRLAAKDTHK